MREILFRGKQIDNGEWVEGYYVKALDMYDKKIHAIFDIATTFYSFGETSGFELVNPETIGQYTGFTDKNAKKIFEGDIVKGRRDYELYEIVYDGEEEGGWSLGIQHEPVYSIGGANSKQYKVVGNIFDNPELLEV